MIDRNGVMTKLDPDPDNQPTLDDKGIDRLRQDMEEDTEIVIGSYIESIGEFLSHLENRDDDTPEHDLHRWAHTVKSSAATIGAMRLAHLAAQLENAYRDRGEIDVDAQLSDMRSEYRRVSRDLRDRLDN
jgi:HPt (histidine-containing phosphotransfer) domain-containing protein